MTQARWSADGKRGRGLRGLLSLWLPVSESVRVCRFRVQSPFSAASSPGLGEVAAGRPIPHSPQEPRAKEGREGAEADGRDELVFPS